MLEQRFSKVTEKVLRKAGWYPGRHVFSTLKLPTGFEIFEAARFVLDEFGSLKLEFLFVEKRKRGSHLDRMGLNIDPLLLSGENQSIDEHSSMIGHSLYPLGELYDPWYDPYEAKIIIDDVGRVFIAAFWATIFIGDTFDNALENILAGGKGTIIENNDKWEEKI